MHVSIPPYGVLESSCPGPTLVFDTTGWGAHQRHLANTTPVAAVLRELDMQQSDN